MFPGCRSATKVNSMIRLLFGGIVKGSFALTGLNGEVRGVFPGLRPGIVSFAPFDKLRALPPVQRKFKDQGSKINDHRNP